MSDLLYEILVPTITNEGRPIRARQHRVWDQKVKELAGGLTVLAPTTIGHWEALDGEWFAERMIPVRIKCSEELIQQIADLTAKFYAQEAVMFYRISNDVHIIHYDEKAKRIKEE